MVCLSLGVFCWQKRREVNALRPEVKAKYEARGIKVFLGTQEEAEAIGTLIYFVPKQRPSKADTPENKEPENEFPDESE
jgi:hypothetical protein